jgi:hypothetical protein
MVVSPHSVGEIITAEDVILRSEAEPVLSKVEGKNPVPGNQKPATRRTRLLRQAQGRLFACGLG